MAPPRLWLSFTLGMLVVAGCPRRFDLRASEIHSQNPETESEFRSAHRKLVDGDFQTAASELRLFLDKHAVTPTEPLLPLARFELGLAEYHRGELDEARRLLAPFSTEIAPGDEATELHAVLADLYRRADQTADALREYELFYRSPQAHALEQAYIRTQVAPLISRLPAPEQKPLRQRFGIETAQAQTQTSSRIVIGLVLPLSGKDRALGERVLHGALWAAQALGARPGEAPGTAVDLRVRDSNSAGGAQAAVADLQREGAPAVIGSPVRAEALAIAQEAEKRGMLAISLHALPDAGKTGTRRTFQLLRTNESRAESLAQHLKTTGLTSVAVLAPQSPYGQTMTKAFIAALAGAAPAIQVVAQLSFAANATTFTAQARQILEVRPQAVFVPATAAQLELVAAQLASVGALSTYRVEKREDDPPVKLLLSSAEGMGERLIKNAGRYLQGAVLAPIAPGGAAVGGGEKARFSGYLMDGGGEPGALDALGYDAVEVLRDAFSAGCASAEAGCTATQLGEGLQKIAALPMRSAGATGPVSFDAAGQRSGQAWLLRVEGNALLPVSGKAAR